MDLKQAYGLLRKEKLSLQNEVRKLKKTTDQISSGSYEDPLKIKHLKQIRDLTWKNKSLQEEADPDLWGSVFVTPDPDLWGSVFVG